MSDELSESEPAAEDDLVVRARTDGAAFGKLFDRYYPRVVRYCLRRLADRACAEDVTLEVFLQVASHMRQFAGQTASDFRRWLFRIATNAVNAHLRQVRRRQELRDAAARDGRLTTVHASQASTAEHDRLDWPVVREALLELDEREQAIVTLRYFADCSYDEIADVVDSTPGAVRTALSRVLAQLRERFDPAQRASGDS